MDGCIVLDMNDVTTEPDRELEQVKGIAEALTKPGNAVSEAAVWAYIRKGTATRTKLPIYRNHRNHVCIMLSTLRAWLAGGIYARGKAADPVIDVTLEAPVSSSPPTLRPAQVAQLLQPGASS